MIIASMPWQLFVTSTLIILTSTFILYTRNTVYCLLGLISMVLSIAWFMIYAGLELLGFMISIVYLGAVLIFFIFVIMLIDLRFENLESIYPEARSTEPQAYTAILPVTIFFNLFVINLYVERILYKEYFGLERLIQPEELKNLSELELIMLSEYHEAYTTGPAAIGFFLFSTEGVAVGVLSLLILFSLFVSLYTIQMANEDLVERQAHKNIWHMLDQLLKPPSRDLGEKYIKSSSLSYEFRRLIKVS